MNGALLWQLYIAQWQSTGGHSQLSLVQLLLSCIPSL